MLSYYSHVFSFFLYIFLRESVNLSYYVHTFTLIFVNSFIFSCENHNNLLCENPSQYLYLFINAYSFSSWCLQILLYFYVRITNSVTISYYVSKTITVLVCIRICIQFLNLMSQNSSNFLWEPVTASHYYV